MYWYRKWISYFFDWRLMCLSPGDISARFLKEVAQEISPALTLLFNASLEQGIVP